MLVLDRTMIRPVGQCGFARHLPLLNLAALEGPIAADRQRSTPSIPPAVGGA